MFVFTFLNENYKECYNEILKRVIRELLAESEVLSVGKVKKHY